MTHPTTDSLNLRSAVRALLLAEPDDDAPGDEPLVMLVRFEFPTATVWALPGGGLEPDEDPELGLRRELREELGLVEFELGPHVWSRLHVIPMMTGHDGQRDQIHLVRVARFDPEPELGWEALRAEYVHELRWWTPSEIEGAASETVWFAPRRLGPLLRDLIEHGPPDTPVDTGV